MSEELKNLTEIQSEVGEWAQKSFGRYADRPFLPPYFAPAAGMVEEVGEIFHHLLKEFQGIRKQEDHPEGIKDGIADFLIYLCDFACAYENYTGVKIDLLSELNRTWNENVSKRKADGKYVPEISLDPLES